MNNRQNNINIEIGKLPPQNIEIEEYVLGSLILESNAIVRAINEGLEIKYFYKEEHQIIASAIFELHSNNIGVDLMTIINSLRSTKELENIGGATAISMLMSNVGTTNNLVDHIAIIKTTYIQRLAIEKSYKLQTLAYNLETEDVLITEFGKGLDEISNLNNSAKALTSEELVETSLKEAQERNKYYQEYGVVMGVKSQIPSLDKALHGFKGGNVYAIGARPGMGKTAFALYLLKAFANQNLNPTMFSLEMSARELTDRLIMSETEINSEKYSQGDLDANDWEQINKAANLIYNLPLVIEDEYSMTVDKIRSKISLQKAKTNCGAVIIDYLQLITPNSANRNYNKNDEVGEISRKLKSISKEFDLPIIILSQLNRECEKTATKKPYMNHFRDSGNIEQDITAALLLYRPEVYDIEEDENGKQYPPNYFEISIGKNRHGHMGNIRMIHSSSMNNFMEYAESYEESVETFNDF